MNSETVFELDARLAQDTLFVHDLALGRVLLMNDRRYPWLILVPRLPGMVELTDLGGEQWERLWDESLHLCRLLKQAYPQGKLNIGALGNVVSQLHVHHVVRHEGDPAWPGPVWGHSEAESYGIAEGREKVKQFSLLLV